MPIIATMMNSDTQEITAALVRFPMLYSRLNVMLLLTVLSDNVEVDTVRAVALVTVTDSRVT